MVGACKGAVQRLGEVVPDLGRTTAGDATALNARRNPRYEGKPSPKTLGQTRLSAIAKALRAPITT
jgi:hypothetical protein